jgi:hypothetical protein
MSIVTYGPEAFEAAHAWEAKLFVKLDGLERDSSKWASDELEGVDRIMEMGFEEQAVLGDLYDSLMSRIRMARHNEIMEIP